MKKALFAALFCCLVLIFAIPAIAQEKSVFLSLTRYAQDMDKMPVNVEVIDSKEIEAGHYETVVEALEKEVGVAFKSNGSPGLLSNVSIRGVPARGVLVLIDGRRINSPNTGDVNYALLPANIIDRIEVIRGAGASIYGTNAIGGVINIITKKAMPYSPIIDADFSYGQFNSYNPQLTAAFYGEKTSLLVSGAYFESDGIKMPNDNTRYDYTDIFYSLQWRPSSKSEFSLTGDNHTSKVGNPGEKSLRGDKYPWGDPSIYTDDYQKDDNHYEKLDFKTYFNDTTYLKLSGYNSVSDSKYYSVSPYEYPDWGISGVSDAIYRYLFRTSGFQADFNFNNFILVGVESRADYYKSESIDYENGSKSYYEHNNDIYSAYAQLNFEVGKFVFIPSVRGDKNEYFGNVAAPAASIIFNALETLKISANAGKVWRAPDFSDLYVYEWTGYGFSSNPTGPLNDGIKPESGMSYDIGAEFSYEKIKLSGTVFNIDLDDKIIHSVTDKDAQYRRSINLEKSNSQGFELGIGFIMFPWLSHNLNYTYTKATDESDSDALGKPNKNKGEQLSYIPKQKAAYTLTVRPVRNLSISGTVSYQDETYDAVYTNEKGDERAAIPAIITSDLYVNYALDKNMTLWLKCLNLGDASYETTVGYPMPRRAVYAGVNIKLWK